MPAFSFTAPQMTPEEELLERENLTPEEREQIIADVFGTGNPLPFDETEDMRHNGPKLLLQRLKELDAKGARRSAFGQALEECPIVVEREINMLSFLRKEKFDIDLAAARVLQYWKYRVMLFGKDRAFLPLNLDGNGALDSEDIETLKKGVLMILPCDENGRTLLYFERTQCYKPNVNRDSFIEDAVEKGFVFIICCKNYELYKHHDRMLGKRMSALTEECFPIRSCAGHVALGNSVSIINVLLPFAKLMMGKHMRLRFFSYKDEHFGEISKYGVPRASLPTMHGGNFSPQDFQQWVSSRLKTDLKQQS